MRNQKKNKTKETRYENPVKRKFTVGRRRARIEVDVRRRELVEGGASRHVLALRRQRRRAQHFASGHAPGHAPSASAGRRRFRSRQRRLPAAAEKTRRINGMEIQSFALDRFSYYGLALDFALNSTFTSIFP